MSAATSSKSWIYYAFYRLLSANLFFSKTTAYLLKGNLFHIQPWVCKYLNGAANNVCVAGGWIGTVGIRVAEHKITVFALRKDEIERHLYDKEEVFLLTRTRLLKDALRGLQGTAYLSKPFLLKWCFDTGLFHLASHLLLASTEINRLVSFTSS